ncbi:sulfonate ABC transporter substrate-binding protein [Paenibacillus hemerocallicola]|uniref:Putative aliphatic sulfonates-binding protein n=2 Tax=Paenibacillus hemerocallicola TaxID=1172614 RepID=A0A5C4T2X7_9BACL|nr:sulfonate ABC transporter substrate-binding protein [Paenibacillus hemerocallicola]
MRIAAAIVLSMALWLLSACGSGSDAKTGASAPAEGAKSADAKKTVKIGYQKYASVNILKEKGGLEEELAKIGYAAEWIQFPGGPQLLEAMNVGSVDFGNVGEAPPIFAQAAGTPLVYLARSPESPKAESILVPKNSAIQKGADLKGKKIALNKGSNVHYLLVKYLEKAGLKYSDVEVVFLPPADARAAFEKGSVDAWVIWEPFYSAAQLATEAKVLADGDGLVSNYEFYLGSRSFAESNRKAVDVILKQLEISDKWAKDNQEAVAKLLAPGLGLDVPSLKQALSHRGYGILPIDDKIIAEQQKVADAFFALKLIPNNIDVSKAVLK